MEIAKEYIMISVQVVEPYMHLVDVPDRAAGIALLHKIEWAARISHRSEDAQTATSWEKFLRSVVLSHGDWSVVEHATASVDACMDRGATHELVRHRLAAYTQESTRFINYRKKISTHFIRPPIPDEAADVWRAAIQQADAAYAALIAKGVTPQLARSVLPTGLAARIVITTNLRQWRHIFLMRTTRESHPQLREVMIPLLHEFQSRIPLLFDDIEPEARQADNLCKPR
jgi:thymidylate synthase (FAD)